MSKAFERIKAGLTDAISHAQGDKNGVRAMNDKDFAGLLQGVKEMTAHMKGEAVRGAVEMLMPDPYAYMAY